MNREQLIRICLNSGVVRRDVAINLIEIIENNVIEEANKRANSSWTMMCEKMVEAEREACAKVVEAFEPDDKELPFALKAPNETSLVAIAEGDQIVQSRRARFATAIRARGETTLRGQQ